MGPEEQNAPFPGARDDTDGASSSRRLTVTSSVSQNADVQNARPAGLPSTPRIPRGPVPSAPARVSVVLKSSPIKAQEYAEYEVKISEATANDEPPRKKRGRPTGWRAGMTFAEARDGAVHNQVARVGRPGRQKQAGHYSLKRRRKTLAQEDLPAPRDVYSTLRPTFTRFLCEWSGCRADLHNLDTLRRHVGAVHVKSQTQHHCLWAKCSAKASPPHSNAAALLKHLEEAHLVPMAWHVGDGPKNSWDGGSKKPCTDGEDIPDFLKDKDGNQVTPSTRDQEIEDPVTYRNNRRKLKELIMRRDENLESQSSEATDEEGDTPGVMIP